MKALIFDFDGLIIDTEMPGYQAWKEIFDSQGIELSVDMWADVVGSAQGYFDPFAHLEEQLGRAVDRETLNRQRRKRSDALIKAQPIRPGVKTYIEIAKQRHMKLGVASNSSVDWVHKYLKHVGLYDRFDTIRCADHVEYPKPAPDLYVAALRELGVKPHQAIAFEDSPHGVRAAKAAGIFSVAVPNELTKKLNFQHADLIVKSLADLPFDTLFTQALSS